MTQDKWLPHICQVSESKCETHTIPFSPKLSLHSPSFPHICSTVMTSVMPHDTLHKFSNYLLTCQPAVPGVQNSKAEGKVQSSKLFLSKALLQLSLYELKPDTSREILFLEQLMGYHQRRTLSVHLHASQQRRGKSRGPLPIMYLYFSFCHFHWHEKSYGTRITFSFSMVCTGKRGSSSPKDAKYFHTFMTADSFSHPVDPFCTKPSL